MAQKKIIEALRFLERQLKESGLSVSKVLLFGSQTKGNSNADSDIDVAVISNDFKNKNIFQRANITKQAEILTIKKFMLPLDIITLTVEEAKNRFALMQK